MTTSNSFSSAKFVCDRPPSHPPKISHPSTGSVSGLADPPHNRCVQYMCVVVETKRKLVRCFYNSMASIFFHLKSGEWPPISAGAAQRPGVSNTTGSGVWTASTKCTHTFFLKKKLLSMKWEISILCKKKLFIYSSLPDKCLGLKFFIQTLAFYITDFRLY